MKYSKTTLMELNHKYSKILRKCALLNAAILMSVVMANPAMAVDAAIEVTSDNMNLNELSNGVITGHSRGIASIDESGFTSSLTTNTIDISGVERGVEAWWGSTVNLGDQTTTSSINVNATSRGLSIFDPDTQVNMKASDTVSIAGDDIGVTIHDGSKLNINAKAVTIASTEGQSVYAGTGSVVNIGDSSTDTITMTGKAGSRAENAGSQVTLTGNTINLSSDNNTVLALAGGAKFDIVGKDVTISGTSDDWAPVHAGNNTTESSGPLATVSITADNISITGTDKAVAAMSQGIVNLVGNTTLSGKNAIVARGGAQVNVNKAGDKVVKMDGNIDFNYDKASSGTKVDAFVDVTLNGADSYWTGNTTASYGTGRAPDESYLKVTSSKLTMKDGAVWNATKITDSDDDTKGVAYAALNDLAISTGTVNIADTTRGIFVDRISATDATFTGGPLNVNESMNVAGTLDVEKGSIINAGTITFASGSSLKAALNGSTVIAGTTGVISGTTNLVLDNANDGDSIVLEGDKSGFTFADNALFNIDFDNANTYTISKKSTEQVAEELAEQGVDSTAAETIGAVAQAGSDNAVAKAIATAVQTGNVAVAEQAAKDLAPTTSAQVMGIAKDVTKLLADVASARLAPMGVAGGDVFQGGGMWVQGLYNYSKQDRTAGNEGFKANTRGVAMGIDGKLSDAMTIGLGYGYTDTSADAGRRDVDVDGHHVFLYGQYQPSNWYANWLLNYGYSKYEEEKSPMGVKMKAKYHVNSYGAQLMSGYQFWSGFAPEAGLRYLLVDRESYTDGAQRIKSDKNDVLTGVAGVRYAKAFNTEKATFTPHANLALTYDFMSDSDEANVQVIGGGSYQIRGERLHRFGVEAGAGLTMSVGAWDLSADYHGGYRRDFQSHTGMLKAKYNF